MPSQLKSNWPQVGPAVTKAKDETLLKKGDEMKFRLIGQMHGPKSGHVYGSHQASAPGEAPATETSALERSIQVEKVDPNTVAVGTDNEYAQVLEFGGGRIAPRHNFQPVGEEMTSEVTTALVDSTRSAIEANSIK
jgi:phage gpG-like protein